MTDPLTPVQHEGEAAPEAEEGVIAVPSGQKVTLQEVIWNAPGPEGLTLRFRFLAPEIAREGGRIAFSEALSDMRALCESYALPRIADYGPAPAQIVISMADRAMPFGMADPAATQFFEAFSIADGACIWEVF